MSRKFGHLLIIAGMLSIAAQARADVLPVALSAAGAAAHSLVLTKRVDTIGFEAYEPMVAARGGTLFVAGSGGPWSSDRDYSANRTYWDSQWRTRLWMSRNQGATWNLVDLLAGKDAAVGNSDVDFALGADGTLYLASMKWDYRSGAGLGIAVGSSRDGGRSWVWTNISSHRFDDRPWLVVARDGTAHLIWNGEAGVQQTISRDRGKTWSPPGAIYGDAGSSHLAIGPRGELALRLIPWAASHNFFNPGTDLIAISTDAGAHWKTSRAPGNRKWGTWAAGTAHDVRQDGVQEFAGKDGATQRCCSGNDVPRWIEPLAWDGRGRLYYLWTDTTGVWLARSVDQGATWTSWKIVESRAPCFYPYLVARGDGELAATWHSGKGDSLRWQAATITVGDATSAPRVLQSQPLELDTFNLGDSLHPSGLRREPAGEYLAVTFLGRRGIGVVTPIQDPRSGRVGFSYWQFKPS